VSARGVCPDARQYKVGVFGFDKLLQADVSQSGGLRMNAPLLVRSMILAGLCSIRPLAPPSLSIASSGLYSPLPGCLPLCSCTKTDFTRGPVAGGFAGRVPPLFSSVVAPPAGLGLGFSFDSPIPPVILDLRPHFPCPHFRVPVSFAFFCTGNRCTDFKVCASPIPTV